MAITRSQIARQLMQEGGVPRQGYFLGKLVKKIKDDIIPNELKTGVGKAATAAALGYGLNRFGVPFTSGVSKSGENIGKGSISNIFKSLGIGGGGRDEIIRNTGKAPKTTIEKISDFVTKPRFPNPNQKNTGPQSIGDRLLSGIFGAPGLAVASGLVAGALTKDKEDPIYTGQDVGLNLQDIAKLANLSDPKTASAIGLRFSPDVAARKFTPAEMAETYAANAPMDFTEQRQGVEEGGIIGDQKDFDQFLQDMKDRDMNMMQEQILRDFEEYMKRKRITVPMQEAKDGGIMKMASAPDPAAEKNDYLEEMSLKYYKKPLKDLTPDEFIDLEEAIEDMGKIENRSDMMASAILGDESDEISMNMFGKPVKELNPSEFRELMDYLDDLQKSFRGAKGGIASMANGGPIDPGYLGIPPVGLGTGQRPGGAPFPNLGDYDSRGMMKKRNKKNKKKKRDKKAEGGMMNLGGMEMDLRGGGFVPMGRAEKADDVPARLSKNEFVFTADAVRAAGGGDVDKGADKMYATMKKLEDRVA